MNRGSCSKRFLNVHLTRFFIFQLVLGFIVFVVTAETPIFIFSRILRSSLNLLRGMPFLENGQIFYLYESPFLISEFLLFNLKLNFI